MTALINFRKLLNENFLLFIISLVLYIQIFNTLYTNETNIYSVLKEINLLIPFVITYVIAVVILTPFTKLMFNLLSFIQFFPFIEKIINFFKSDEKDEQTRHKYISFEQLKALSIEYDSTVLYNIYTHHKNEEEREIFTSKFSFLNVILIVLNYFIVNNGIVQFIIFMSEDQSNLLVSVAIFIEILIIIMFLYGIQYMKPDHYKISISEIEGLEKHNKTLEEKQGDTCDDSSISAPKS